jgi:hypothetical protein
MRLDDGRRSRPSESGRAACVSMMGGAAGHLNRAAGHASKKNRFLKAPSKTIRFISKFKKNPVYAKGKSG